MNTNTIKKLCFAIICTRVLLSNQIRIKLKKPVFLMATLNHARKARSNANTIKQSLIDILILSYYYYILLLEFLEICIYIIIGDFDAL